MKKQIVAFIFSFITLFSFGMFCVPKQQGLTKAEQSGLVIRAYGDSISAGDTLPDNANYTSGVHDICEGCYSDVFGKQLIAKFGGSVKSFAHSGDKTSDLVTILNSQSNDEILATDIFTLCIGANNVLGPAISKMSDYLIGGVNETEYRGILQTGLDNFKADYTNIILPKLTQNPNAKVIVMTVYNPYLYLDLEEAQIDASFSSFVQVVKANFSQMLAITMEYLTEINNTIIQSKVDSKIFVADVKSKFDTFSETEYKQYINADASKIVISSYADLSNLSSALASACDPHPTLLGQQQIAQVFSNAFNYLSVKSQDKLSNITDGEQQVSIIFESFKDDVVYNAYKIVNGTRYDVEIESSLNGHVIILAKNLNGQGSLYITITNKDEQDPVYTTSAFAFNNNISTNDPTPPDENIDPPPSEEDNNNENTKKEVTEQQLMTIYVIIGIGILCFGIIITTVFISTCKK